MKLDEYQSPTLWTENKAREAIEYGDDKALRKLLTSSDPHVSLAAIRVRLEYVGGYDKKLQKIANCNSHTPCHEPLCDRCAIPSLVPFQHQRESLQKSRSTSFSKDPQARAAQQVEHFHRYPQDQVWAVTINFEASSTLELQSRIKTWRGKLRNVLKTKLPESVVWGRFETKPMRADRLDPDTISNSKSLEAFHPQDPVLKLHIHFLIHIPEGSREDLRVALEKRFGTGNIVNIRSIKNDFDDVDEEDHQGIAGFARYAAKGFVELDALENQPIEDMDSVIRSYLDTPRRDCLFQYNTRSISTYDNRIDGRWIRYAKQRYSLPDQWSRDRVEKFLMWFDLDLLTREEITVESIMSDIKEDIESWEQCDHSV